MTLGSDVSRLSTTAANAAAQGLSIIVPVYNAAAVVDINDFGCEPAGLAQLAHDLHKLRVKPRQPQPLVEQRHHNRKTSIGRRAFSARNAGIAHL